MGKVCAYTIRILKKNSVCAFIRGVDVVPYDVGRVRVTCPGCFGFSLRKNDLISVHAFRYALRTAFAVRKQAAGPRGGRRAKNEAALRF